MRPRPATIFAVLALLIGLALSPRASLPNPQFDTSFWDLSEVGAPTNGTIGPWQTLKSGVLRSEVTYFSEMYCGSPVIISGLLFRPVQGDKFPAVLLMHGSFGSAESMAYFGELLATEGYVALAVSGPGQGGSTGPAETNENRLNLTSRPYYSYYYRLLYSAMRGVTFLGELPFVDSGRVGAAGASQGGLESLWLSALDDRLKAVVPIVGGGNFSLLVYSGSLALGHLPSNVRLDDPRSELLMRYFDPLAYVTKSRVPVLMLVGTSDEFFPLDSYNQTYSSIASEKAMLIVPNTGHFVAREEWILSAEAWLSKWLKGEGEFPRVTISSLTRKDGCVEVNATGIGVDGMVLNIRDGWPWSRWESYPMSRSGDLWTVALPLSAVDFTAYVSGTLGGSQVVSSSTRRFKAETAGLACTAAFLTCIFLVALLVRVSLTMDWLSALERSVTWCLLWSSTLLPVLMGGGVAPLSIWTIMNTFQLWVNPAVPFLIFAMLPVGALIAGGSDRALKIISVLSVLATALFSAAVISYVGSEVNLAVGAAIWVQLAIVLALFVEPLVARKPPSLDRSIAVLFKEKPKQ